MSDEKAIYDQNRRDEAIDSLEIQIKAILHIAKESAPSQKVMNDVHWVEKIVNACIASHNSYEIMVRIRPKISHYRKQILANDEEFFKQESFSSFIKNDGNQQFMNNLINVVKAGFLSLTPELKAQVWRCLEEIVRCVAQFRLHDPADPVYKR